MQDSGVLSGTASGLTAIGIQSGDDVGLRRHLEARAKQLGTQLTTDTIRHTT